jgi:hypothetical protein
MDGEAFDHARLDGLEWFAYSTYSHSDSEPHYHLVLPLAHKVPASLWRVVWAELHQRVGLIGDPQTKDVARIFYLPQHAPDASFEFHDGHGELLDSSFRLDIEVASNPVSPRPKQVRQPVSVGLRTRISGDDVSDDLVDISRWDGMSKKELYTAALEEFIALRNGLSVIE